MPIHGFKRHVNKQAEKMRMPEVKQVAVAASMLIILFYARRVQLDL